MILRPRCIMPVIFKFEQGQPTFRIAWILPLRPIVAPLHRNNHNMIMIVICFGEIISQVPKFFQVFRV